MRGPGCSAKHPKNTAFSESLVSGEEPSGSPEGAELTCTTWHTKHMHIDTHHTGTRTHHTHAHVHTYHTYAPIHTPHRHMYTPHTSHTYTHHTHTHVDTHAHVHTSHTHTHNTRTSAPTSSLPRACEETGTGHGHRQREEEGGSFPRRGCAAHTLSPAPCRRLGLAQIRRNKGAR